MDGAPDEPDEANEKTSATLIGRLAATPGDSIAWGEFVARYGPMIKIWCRSRGLQNADVDDVAQSVLMRIADRIRNFEYDATLSFRAWLKTLTHHAWYDFVQKENRNHASTGKNAWPALMTTEARDDLSERLEQEYDAELLEMAIFRVKLRVNDRTWNAFELSAIQQKSGAEVAAELGMKVAHVYVAKGEVMKRLKDELSRME